MMQEPLRRLRPVPVPQTTRVQTNKVLTKHRPYNSPQNPDIATMGTSSLELQSGTPQTYRVLRVSRSYPTRSPSVRHPTRIAPTQTSQSRGSTSIPPHPTTTSHTSADETSLDTDASGVHTASSKFGHKYLQLYNATGPVMHPGCATMIRIHPPRLAQTSSVGREGQNQNLSSCTEDQPAQNGSTKKRGDRRSQWGQNGPSKVNPLQICCFCADERRWGLPSGSSSCPEHFTSMRPPDPSHSVLPHHWASNNRTCGLRLRSRPPAGPRHRTSTYGNLRDQDRADATRAHHQCSTIYEQYRMRQPPMSDSQRPYPHTTRRRPSTPYETRTPGEHIPRSHVHMSSIQGHTPGRATPRPPRGPTRLPAKRLQERKKNPLSWALPSLCCIPAAAFDIEGLAFALTARHMSSASHTRRSGPTKQARTYKADSRHTRVTTAPSPVLAGAPSASDASRCSMPRLSAVEASRISHEAGRANEAARCPPT
ncbi:hypothetical protein BC628DRAFT_1496585 [Trametes gibbosa]|nr:hypothetical protein BC628DRAFT_1496585 [Trametes gibbosa]